MSGFVLLVRPRGDGDKAMRVGITVSGKVGGAVVRNRMKRRLRELARAVLPESGIAGADHILIGRTQGIEREYGLLETELRKALGKLAKRAGPVTSKPGLAELVEARSFASSGVEGRKDGPSTSSGKSVVGAEAPKK